MIDLGLLVSIWGGNFATADAGGWALMNADMMIDLGLLAFICGCKDD
jgi:hypothetical protein